MRNWFRKKWLKLKAWVVALLVALGLILPAFADSVTLSWTNATQYENGDAMPIEEIFETVLYREAFPLGTDVGAVGRSYAELVRVPPTETSYLDDNLANGIYCYVATHVAVNGAESAQSGETCKTIDVRVPGAPVGLGSS